MPDVRYNHAQIGKAVQTLAVHPGRVKERLSEAANHLAIVDPSIFKVEGMYEGAAGTWEKIQEAVRPTPDATFAAAIERLSEKAASDVAQLIVSIDSMVGSYFDNQ
jgi:hypothetical protein